MTDAYFAQRRAALKAPAQNADESILAEPIQVQQDPTAPAPPIPEKRVLKDRTVWDVLGDFSLGERTPFLGSALEYKDLGSIVMTARRVQAGRGSEQDKARLDAFVAEQDRETTWAGKVADVVLSIPKFAVEIAASGGVLTLAGKSAGKATKILASEVVRKKIAEGAAKIAASRVAKSAAAKAVKGVANVAARVAVIDMLGGVAGGMVGIEQRGGMIHAAAARKALGRASWQQDEFGHFQLTMDSVVPTTLDMMPQGVIDSMIEVGTELSGGWLLGKLGLGGHGGKDLAEGAVGAAVRKSAVARAAEKAGIPYVPLMSQVKALQLKVLDAWVNKVPGGAAVAKALTLTEGSKRTIQQALKIMEKGGYNGILGEVLEERLGGALNIGASWLPGYEDDFDGLETLFPGFADLSVELAAFAVPIGALHGAMATKEAAIRRYYGSAVGDRALSMRMRQTEAAKAFDQGAGFQDHYGAQQEVPIDPRKAQQRPLSIDDIQTEQPSYLVGNRDQLTEEEKRQAQLHKEVIGGEDFGRRRTVWPGLAGTTVDTRADKGAPAVEWDQIHKVAEDLANTPLEDRLGHNAERATIGIGRADNVGSTAEQKKSSKWFEEGVNPMALHGRIARAKDAQELAMRSMQLLMLRRFGKRMAGREKYTLELKDFEKGGALNMDDAALAEALGVGSIQDPITEGNGERQLHRGLLEFFTMYLTKSGARKEFLPALNNWFEGVFSVNEPEIRQKMDEFRDTVDQFRFQGARNRFENQHWDKYSRWKKLQELHRQMLSKEGRDAWKARIMGHALSRALYLDKLDKAFKEFYQRVHGRDPRKNESLVDLEEALAKTEAAMSEQFIERYPIDYERARVPGKSLGEIMVAVRGKMKLFSNYLMNRRVLATWRDKPAIVEVDEFGNETVQFGGEANAQKLLTTSEPRLGGIGAADARAYTDWIEENHPELVQAAEDIYEWWDNVLNYLGQSSHFGRATVERMRLADPGNYAPLNRIFDSWIKKVGAPTNMQLKAQGETITKSLEGSMEAVQDVFSELVKKAEELFALGHAMRIEQEITRYADEPFAQEFMRKLRPDEVPEHTTKVGELIRMLQATLEAEATGKQFDQARMAGVKPSILVNKAKGGSLEEAISNWLTANGAAYSDIMDRTMAFFGPDRNPSERAQNLLVRITPEGKVEYLEIVDWGVMRFYQAGLDQKELGAISKTFVLSKKIFTSGTTALRPVFLAKNMVRDFLTAIINTQSDVRVFNFSWIFRDGANHPMTFLGAWMRELASEFKLAATEDYLAAKGREAKVSQARDVAMRVGGLNATQIRNDTLYTRDMLNRLNGKKRGKFKLAWDYYGGILAAGENVTRIAEVRLVADKLQRLGRLDSLDRIPEAEWVELLLAMKRVSTNFSVSGETVGYLNMFWPFLNAAVQGPRDTLRALVQATPEQRQAKMLRLMKTFTLPSIALWFLIKDEDWWIELTDEERAMAWYLPVPGGTQVAVVPMPFEIGTVFSAMPVSILDAWYRDDPATLDEFFGDMIQGSDAIINQALTLLPSGGPPLIRATIDTMRNKKSFFNTPIVSQSLEGLAPEAQYDEFTTGLAKWIGKLPKSVGFEYGWSPKKVDYIIASLGGRVSADLAKVATGQDAQDLGGVFAVPIVGGFFKEPLAHPKEVNAMYDAYHKLQVRFDTKVVDEDDRQRGLRLAMRDAMRAVTAIGIVMRDVADPKQRKALQEERLRIARAAMGMYYAGEVDPEQRTIAVEARKLYEPQKKSVREREKQRRKDELGD